MPGVICSTLIFAVTVWVICRLRGITGKQVQGLAADTASVLFGLVALVGFLFLLVAIFHLLWRMS